MPRYAAALALVTALLGCEEVSAGPPDAAAGEVGDAAPRVLERMVSVEVPAPATRELTEGPGGELMYGEIMPLSGAKVCATERRDAFALDESFEPLNDPICEISDGGTVILKRLPANSDLVVITTHEEIGLEPVVTTLRTDERDFRSSLPPFVRFFNVLLAPGAVDPWVEPAPATAPDQGLVSIEVWLNFWHAQPEPMPGKFLNGESKARPGDGFELHIVPMGEEEAVELVAGDSRPRFLRAPEGLARLEITPFERVNCRSCGVSADMPYGGLPTDVQEVIDVPVRTGSRTAACFECWCSDPDGAPLDDPDRCAFGEAEEDAGMP